MSDESGRLCARGAGRRRALTGSLRAFALATPFAAVAGAATGDERQRQHRQWLESGEQALSRLRIDDALDAFEKAAASRHSVDAEVSLVRAYMQRGDYRRALTFASHTAGAHREQPEGAAAYAWLLHVGGQRAVAQRVLAEAMVRSPGQPVLDAMRGALSRDRIETPLLREPPMRLAPYVGPGEPVPDAAQVVASGLLLAGGQRAIVPSAAMRHGSRLRVCNGLGRQSVAHVERELAAEGLLVLRLEAPMAVATIDVAPADPFPGSPAHTVEYTSGGRPIANWPLLRSGFVGRAAGEDVATGRELGIELPPGPRGGPVFDGSARLVGVALAGRPGSPDRLLVMSRLRPVIEPPRGDAGQSVAARRAGLDEVYELALGVTLQVIDESDRDR